MVFKVSVYVDIDIEGMSMENWGDFNEEVEEHLTELVSKKVNVFAYKPVEED